MSTNYYMHKKIIVCTKTWDILSDFFFQICINVEEKIGRTLLKYKTILIGSCKTAFLQSSSMEVKTFKTLIYEKTFFYAFQKF